MRNLTFLIFAFAITIYQHQLTEEDACFLCRYHLGNTHFIKPEQSKQITEDERTLFLFATHEPRIAYNNFKLRQAHSHENPVAKIRPVYTDDDDISKRRQPGHFDDQVEPCTYFCRNAKVEIKGRNILPQLGLYNGAMGTVVDIVYHDEESPLSGHLPRYVLVRLPSYSGPPFLPDDPQVVPIVPLSRFCDRRARCCKQHYIPLLLCFAKTIHAYQGQNAGPTAPGQPQNPIQRLVIDIGPRRFEGNNPGLSYTAFSRVTKLGHEGNIMDSALYFTGGHMRPSRILDIRKKCDGKGDYKKVVARTKWVQYLQKNLLVPATSQEKARAVFDWADRHRPGHECIQKFHEAFCPTAFSS